ncbi:hypothetical protein [Peribacillus sp. SCS-155]|uniref:hypothetical protein n=1 Tax=Peribacillus sedimenti TaxID=3115297 RepID=UPI0039069CB9
MLKKMLKVTGSLLVMVLMVGMFTKPAEASTTYHFGKTSFSNYIWLNSGYSFYSPYFVQFEKYDANTVRVEVYNSANAYLGSQTYTGSGWKVFSLNGTSPSGLWMQGKFAKFKFVNLSGGTADIYQGDVRYNW